MFAKIVWPQQLANISLCYVVFDTKYQWKCIFSHSLAKLPNMIQDTKSWQTYTPQIWRAKIQYKPETKSP